MKPRKELKPGDKVRFFGYASQVNQSTKIAKPFFPLKKTYYNVKSDKNNYVCLELLNNPNYLLYIDLRQVTHVKRKKQKRYFFIRKCLSSRECMDNGKFFAFDFDDEPKKECQRCEIIKVREVK